MPYDEFFKGLKSKDIRHIEEDVIAWRKASENDKAAIIQEIKLSSNMQAQSYLNEITEKALTNPNTEAGGSGDETGKPVAASSKSEPKEATAMTDDDPDMSDKTKIAAASGIGSGLGAMYLAKKMRRTQAAS